MSIQIQVRNKVAVNLTPEEVIVCGNSGYDVAFSFDDEWASKNVKTARFVYRKGGQNYYDDVVFTGTTVKAPVLSNINYVLVGVYAGDLITSTPAVVECDKSILCGSGTHKDPDPDVYNQLIKLINSGGATDEKITQAVSDYLAENPVSGGLSSKEKGLMLTLFKNMLSQNNMSDTVNELEKIWGSGDSGEEEPDTPDTTETYTITYYLTNVVSSNSEASITGGESFIATLEATENHKLGNVAVTMGGIDVTDSVYADGVITIASVTGNIIINATASEMSGAVNWEAGVPYEYAVIENEYVGANGTILTEEGQKRTDYIPCYGVDYVSSSTTLGDATTLIAFYGGTKNYISSSLGHGIKYFSVPENAAYFVVSRGNVGNGFVLTPGLDIEATWDDGVPYTLTPFVENEYVSGDKFLSYDGWSRTDYMNCVGATKIVFSCKINYGAFYDSNKTYVSSINTHTSEDNSVTVTDFASYFIVSASDAAMSALVATPYA